MRRKVFHNRIMTLLICLAMTVSFVLPAFASETAAEPGEQVAEATVFSEPAEEEPQAVVTEEPAAEAEPDIPETIPEERKEDPAEEPEETETAPTEEPQAAVTEETETAAPDKTATAPDQTKKDDPSAVEEKDRQTDSKKTETADTKAEKDDPSAKTAKTPAAQEKTGQTTKDAAAKAEAEKTAGSKEEKEARSLTAKSTLEEKFRIRSANAAAVDNSTTLSDGEYTDFEWLWEGGSGKARLTLTKIVVSGGKATGYFTASSDTLSHVYYLGHTSGQDDDPVYYDPATDTCGDGVKAITDQKVSFPVCLNKKTEVAMRSVAMSAPHWIQYEYTITIDDSEEEQVTALTVTNDVSGLTIRSAELAVGKNSGRTTLRMTAGDKTFTKLFLGTAADAQKDGAKTLDLSDKNVFSVSPFTANEKTDASFYSSSDQIWHDASLTVDTSAGTLTLKEGEKADYSKVEAAKAKVPKDLSIYQEVRVKTLKDALADVVEGLYASEQERVDAFADAIEKAIAALEKEKLTIKLKAVDKDTGKKISKATFTVTNEKGKTVKADSDGVYSLENGTYTIKATAKNYEDAVRKNYTPKVEETLTLELEPKEIIPKGTIIFKENTKDPSKTNLFNTTGMFKVVKGTLVSKKSRTTLTISLNGEGYHYLYKGTYEEALANGLNKKNWIKGSVNSDGKWEFVIPLGESETFIPVISISQSRLEKVEKGEEELGNAFYARQLVLDLKKKTLTAGDYDAVVDITVVSKTEKFKAKEKGKMEVVGGPNSNNYACKPTITMQDKRFSKAFVGTAKNAAKKGSKPIKLNNGKFSFEFANSYGSDGKNVTFEDKKPIAVAFYDTKEKEWADYKLTIDKAASTVTIEALKKDEEPPEEPEKPDPEQKDDSDKGTSAVDSGTTLADGVYTPKSFTFSGGTGKVIILLDKLEIKGGQAYATIRFAKPDGGAASVDRLRANGQELSGSNVFTIPVELNANNKIVARTTAMSVPHWIEYSIFIAMDEPGKETKEEGNDLSENLTEMDEEAPSILGLVSAGETKTDYSDLVKIFNYEGGYYLVEIDAVRDTARDTVEQRTQLELAAMKEAEKPEESAAETENEAEEAEEGSSSAAVESISDKIAKLYENEIIKYLVIPEGKEVPAGLDKEVIIISQPLDKTYVSSASALEMLAALGAAENIAAVGLGEKDVTVPEIAEAMKKEDGAVAYAGAYDDWDLRQFILQKLNFAVQSSDILPKDEKTIEEDMENLVRLGQRSAQMEMAMFIDRSEDEANSLAAAEWYKVYGVLFGCTEQAEKCYQDVIGKASEKEKEEAEALLKTRAEANSKMKAEAKEAAEKQAQEG